MANGLFALTCPKCGDAMELGPAGTGTCVACELTYMTRFGYFIPVDHRPVGMTDSAVAAVAESPALLGTTGAGL